MSSLLGFSVPRSICWDQNLSINQFISEVKSGRTDRGLGLTGEERRKEKKERWKEGGEREGERSWMEYQHA